MNKIEDSNSSEPFTMLTTTRLVNKKEMTWFYIIPTTQVQRFMDDFTLLDTSLEMMKIDITMK